MPNHILQWGFHALQQKLSQDARNAHERVLAKMKTREFKAHPFALKATGEPEEIHLLLKIAPSKNTEPSY
jgi:hypothetical protein